MPHRVMATINNDIDGDEPLLLTVCCDDNDPTSFWKAHLSDAPKLLEITTDRPRVAGTPNNHTAGGVNFTIDTTLLEGLKALADNIGKCSVWNILLVSWNILLARYSRMNDVVVGVPVRHRDSAMRLMPVRTELTSSSCNAIILHSTIDLIDILRNKQVLRLEDVITITSTEQSASYTPLFQTLFSFEYDGQEHDFVWTPAASQRAAGVQYDLELHVSSTNTFSSPVRLPNLSFSGRRQLSAVLKYRSSIFDKYTAKQLSSHFLVFLRNMVAAGGRESWRSIPLMNDEEMHEVVYKLNDTATPYPQCCIHDMFEEQALKHPQRICLIYDNVPQSYRCVYQKTMAISRRLKALGVGVEDSVSLLMERSDLVTIAIYGILFSGAAYVPLDITAPNDRLQHIIDDCGSKILVTTESLNDKVPASFSGTVLHADTFLKTATIDEDILSTARERRKESVQNPDTLVYIFYTSGTTGKPKGVEVTHRGLVKRIAWFQQTYALTPADRVINKTPYVFGISEWEFFWPLPCGATLVVAKEGGQKDPEYLLELTKAQKVTVATYVPSMLSLAIDYMKSVGANYSTAMRLVICCGEALPIDVCYKFFEVFASDTAKLHNLYGPTEADMTYWECPPLEPGTYPRTLKKIPIGLPMSNVKVYVLDENRTPVPPGVPGELYFGGATTARGYVGLPELTAEKFVDNPFKETADGPKMYRTGDCVRWLPDKSNLEFLGRVDNQVKLRGFRIELGEIEHVLCDCQGVGKAAVIVTGQQAASQRLVAYITPETIDVASIEKEIKRKLPEYMLPSIIMPIPEMPLTSRGKLDRSALPEPVAAVAASKAGSPGFAGTTTDMQRTIEAIWQNILNTKEPLGIHEDFVLLGGNSLLAGRATTEIRLATKSPIPATAMYTHSTIAKIAEVCEANLVREEVPHTEVVGGNLNRPYGGMKPTPAKTLAQFIGMVASLFVGQASFIPAWVYLYSYYYTYGAMWCSIAVAPVLALTVFAVIMYTVVMKRLILWRSVPGTYPVYSWYYIRWWFVSNLVRNTNHFAGPFTEGTEAFNMYLRLLGAQIGDRVDVHSDEIDDPDLVTIGDDTAIERKAVVVGHAIENGYLILLPVEIGSDCRVQPVAHVTQGTRVPNGSTVGPLATTGCGNHKHIIKHEGGPTRVPYTPAQNVVRILFGIPTLFILEALAAYPCILFAEWLWYHGLDLGEDAKYPVFCLILAWVYKFMLPDTMFALALIIKYTVIGTFTPGARAHTFWDEYRRWLWERIVKTKYFEEALEPWINTEVLSCKYRLLGAKVGLKVHADYIDIVEHDLVRIGADAVFGSKVVINTTDHVESRAVVVQQQGQILDHTTLMPGAIVGEGGLCGSSTVGPKFHNFLPHSINTGNQAGRPVQLRIKRDIEKGGLSHLPEKERLLAMQGLANHHSNVTWSLFNLFNIGAVLIIFAFPAVIELLSVVVWMWLQTYPIFNSDGWGYVLCMLVTPPIYQMLYIIEGLFIVTIKWVVVGRYKEGDYPFYGTYHKKWVVMMLCKMVMNHLVEEMNGTPFITWFMRLNGAKIGKQVVCFGDALEYDLLEIGDYACIGERCDITCHTVENMVIKTAPVRMGKQCTLRVGAFVMPGGSMLEGSVLMEASQVLKGETVGEDAVYAGQPAEPVVRTVPELASSNTECDTNELVSEHMSPLVPPSAGAEITEAF
eukprot:TRINITY_DN10154_c0_g1_i1.p1 TRINITY_DN10154_c0_g1~~TRINITY_DN10154_c0_g1_i1.p1  ORF type:complete len:1685 (+),score=419.26 TRINITY_DN10154_c0_g1_i1:2828-7882(+)